MVSPELREVWCPRNYVWSAKTRRFPSSRRGLCHAPPIGCNLSTNRKRKPKWRRCVAASIAVGPSAILTGSRTRPSDWDWNGRFGPVEGRRNNRRLATVTGGSLLFFLGGCLLFFLLLFFLGGCLLFFLLLFFLGGCLLFFLPEQQPGDRRASVGGRLRYGWFSGSGREPVLPGRV